MTTIEFIPLYYSNFDWNERNYMKVYGRTKEGKKACVIHSIPVYFWAILKEEVSEKDIEKIKSKIEKIEFEDKSRTVKALKVEVKDKNFLGKQVKALKVHGTNYKDLHAIADKLDYKEIEARREYDISFTTKFIIDSGIVPMRWCKIEGELLNNSHEFGGIDSALDVDIVLKVERIEETRDSEATFTPKALAYDIECDEFEIGKGEIVMISLAGKNLKKVLTWKKCTKSPDFVECYKNEEEMLEGFLKLVKKEAPDLLVGYYSDGFDLPYLRARANSLGIKLNLGLDGSQPYFTRGRVPSGDIEGISHIDLFKFIETDYSQYLQSETLSLNEVASELLGEKKVDFEFKHSSKIKENEWKTYFEYNLQDSVLTYKLFEKVWPDFIEFSRIMSEPLYNVTRDSMSSHVENYILHNLHKYNEIAEKRPVHDEIEKRMKREKYEGAFVFQPTPGLYENLAGFDFTSYWPSIIVTFNLSRSTFLQEGARDSLEVDIGKPAYFTKKPGFFPQMLSEIIEKRKKYKQEYNKDKNPITKARSNAYKLLANASYGYQGFFGARYYCPEASAATTSISRDFIKKIIDNINSRGYKVIYADTDGIFFLLKKNTKEGALKFLRELNSELPGIMELELEDFYKRGIWVTKRTGEFGAKKKYALIDEKNKMKIRGFETVRRDWCPLARELQSKVLEYILEDGNETRALAYFIEVLKKLKIREINKKDIMIRTQLKKPLNEYKSITPHVIAAQKLQESGEPIRIGMLVQFFIAETREKKSLVREKVKLPDEKGEYNIKYYVENQLIPAVENIFETFNINVKEKSKEITEGRKQKKLGEF